MTPQLPYILQEVQGINTFKVAGAPNTKVSWMVIAERNDPYLQQNPQAKAVIEQKVGPRAGKYWNPGLYGAPDSERITAAPDEVHQPTQVQRASTRPQLNAPRPVQIKDGE